MSTDGTKEPAGEERTPVGEERTPVGEERTPVGEERPLEATPGAASGEATATPGPAATAARSGAAGATPDTMTRFLAFLVDAVVVGVVGMVPIIGGLAGIAYALFRDGLDVDFMRHRSLGKRLMKLSVVRLDGRPMDLATSAQRNWPLVFGSLAQILLFIPVLGWILIPFVAVAGLVFVVIEIVRVLTATDGRRWGDGLAGTRVVVAAD